MAESTAKLSKLFENMKNENGKCLRCTYNKYISEINYEKSAQDQKIYYETKKYVVDVKMFILIPIINFHIMYLN